MAAVVHALYHKWSVYSTEKRIRWLQNRGWDIKYSTNYGQLATRVSKQGILYVKAAWSLGKEYPNEPINSAYKHECKYGNDSPVIEELIDEHAKLSRRLDRLAREEAFGRYATYYYDKEFPFIKTRLEDIEQDLKILTKFKEIK